MSINPLHPETRAFLSSLYAHRGAHLVQTGLPLEEAKAEARTLAMSFRDALLDGTLLEPEPNVIVNEMAAGLVPEEFRRRDRS